MVRKPAVEPNSAIPGDLITCKEGAPIVRLSEISIRRMLTKGKLKRYKCGARTLISRSELLGLIHLSSE